MDKIRQKKEKLIQELNTIYELEYKSFRLEELAKKIKMQTYYKPKPRMYYC